MIGFSRLSYGFGKGTIVLKTLFQLQSWRSPLTYQLTRSKSSPWLVIIYNLQRAFIVFTLQGWFCHQKHLWNHFQLWIFSIRLTTKEYHLTITGDTLYDAPPVNSSYTNKLPLKKCLICITVNHTTPKHRKGIEVSRKSMHVKSKHHKNISKLTHLLNRREFLY